MAGIWGTAGKWDKEMKAWLLSSSSCIIFVLFWDGPATVERIHQHAGVTPDLFTFWSTAVQWRVPPWPLVTFLNPWNCDPLELEIERPATGIPCTTLTTNINICDCNGPYIHRQLKNTTIKNIIIVKHYYTCMDNEISCTQQWWPSQLKYPIGAFSVSQKSSPKFFSVSRTGTIILSFWCLLHRKGLTFKLHNIICTQLFYTCIIGLDDENYNGNSLQRKITHILSVVVFIDIKIAYI